MVKESVLVRFSKIIVHVANVADSLAFYGKAFGLQTRIVQGENYGELETGATVIAFAQTMEPVAGRTAFRIALVADDVVAAFKRAVDAGATPLQDPQAKPWGQTVAYVRCPDGTFVDLTSTVSATATVGS